MADHRIYHLALHDEWLAAVESDTAYRRSTLGQSLADVGFIHCSRADQVQQIADLFYRGRDVVLLAIDTAKLTAEVRVEHDFPHIYGPLPLDAVVSAQPVPADDDGRLEVDELLGNG